MTQPKLMIATPTSGTVKTGFMMSMMAMMDHLSSKGIPYLFDTCDGSDIPQQRNYLGTKFLRDTDCTHTLQIDSDMIVPVDLGIRMLERHKPVLGCICAAKRIEPHRVQTALQAGATFETAQLFGNVWLVFLPESQKQLCVQDGITRVQWCGFGATLIERTVMEQMVRRGAAPLYLSVTGGELHNFFGLRPEQAAEGRHVSEDHSFCLRWSENCGGEIWAMADVTIYHIGDYAFGGNYLSMLQAANDIKRA